MAIVTRPADFTKGTPATYQLNKADLVAHPTVDADTYFKEQTNWAGVSVVMKSTTGGQTKNLVFRTSEATPTADFLPSLTSKDDFEVYQLTIFDKDGGRLTLEREDLDLGASSTADFDISVMPPPSLYEFSATYSGANLDSDDPVISVIASKPSNPPFLSGGRMTFDYSGDSQSGAYYVLPGPMAIGQTGAIHFDWTPRSLTPIGSANSIIQATIGGNIPNRVYLSWVSGGDLLLIMSGDNSVQVFDNFNNALGNWAPGAIQSYNFKLEWDITGGVGVGYARLYIDDVLFGTVTMTDATTRSDTVTAVSVSGAAYLFNPQTGIVQDIDNIFVYSEPQVP